MISNRSLSCISLGLHSLPRTSYFSAFLLTSYSKSTPFSSSCFLFGQQREAPFTSFSSLSIVSPSSSSLASSSITSSSYTTSSRDSPSIQSATKLHQPTTYKPSHENILLRMNEIHNNPGYKHAIKRVGRGIGSGRGKTSTRGMNGQRKRAGFNLPVGFEGGQTPIHKKMPKLSEKNNAKTKKPYLLSIGDLQMWISMGRLEVPTNRLLTMKDLMDSGRFKANAVKDGLKLVTTPECFEWYTTSNLHIEVTDADPGAIQMIEGKGGSVTCAHFNDLALRVHLNPQKFPNGPLPRRARPPPKLMPRYLDYSLRGYLSPEVQFRNRKLLGYVTSDKMLEN